MTDRFDFWVHGAAALIDWEGISYEDITGQEKHLENPRSYFKVRRDARGCLLEQKKPKKIGQKIYQPYNEMADWYAEITVPVSFAIPTATWLDDDETDHYYAFLNCESKMLNRPRFNSIQIFKGKILIKKYTWPWFSKQNALGKDIRKHVLDLPNERCDAPLLIYVKLLFNRQQDLSTPYNELDWIWFEGAGARIEERT